MPKVCHLSPEVPKNCHTFKLHLFVQIMAIPGGKGGGATLLFVLGSHMSAKNSIPKGQQRENGYQGTTSSLCHIVFLKSPPFSVLKINSGVT